MFSVTASENMPKMTTIKLNDKVSFHLPASETDGKTVTGAKIYRDVAHALSVTEGCKGLFGLYPLAKQTSKGKPFVSFYARIPCEDGTRDNEYSFTNIQHGENMGTVLVEFFQKQCK
jgi:hypothetical protein